MLSSEHYPPIAYTMRLLCYAVAAFMALLAQTGCSAISGSIYETLEQPDLNPAAKDILRITVLSKADVNVRLQANYYTSNPYCQVQKWPGNPKVGHTKDDVFEVPAQKDGAVIEVLIDRYKPGHCHWSFGGMSIGAVIPGDSSQGWSGLLTLRGNGSVPSKPLVVTCREYGPSKRVSCDSIINRVHYDVRDITVETRSSK
jgi:hypothetical protein